MVAICCLFQESCQATGHGLRLTSSLRVPALDEGPKDDSTNDCSMPALEKVLAVLSLVPLVIVSLWHEHIMQKCAVEIYQSS
jgi:hypothetical protein